MVPQTAALSFMYVPQTLSSILTFVAWDAISSGLCVITYNVNGDLEVVLATSTCHGYILHGWQGLNYCILCHL